MVRGRDAGNQTTHRKISQSPRKSDIIPWANFEFHVHVGFLFTGQRFFIPMYSA